MIYALALMTNLLYAQEVCYSDINQDLNCNGIDVVDENPVDISDPLCAANVDNWHSIPQCRLLF